MRTRSTDHQLHFLFPFFSCISAWFEKTLEGLGKNAVFVVSILCIQMPRLLAAGDAKLEKFSLDDRAQIPSSASLQRSNSEIFNQNCSSFSTAGKTIRELSSDDEVLFKTEQKKERDKSKRRQACRL